jgi:hypothetical protein
MITKYYGIKNTSYPESRIELKKDCDCKNHEGPHFIWLNELEKKRAANYEATGQPALAAIVNEARKLTVASKLVELGIRTFQIVTWPDKNECFAPTREN